MSEVLFDPKSERMRITPGGVIFGDELVRLQQMEAEDEELGRYFYMNARFGGEPEAAD